MGYTLRQYQADAAGRGVEFLLDAKKQKKGRNGVIYLGTGAGKSLVIGTMAVELANHPRGGPVLVSQPSKEILEQNYEKIKGYGFTPAVYSASMGKREIGDITLVTIGSIFREPELFSDFAFMIPDEAHLVSAAPVKKKRALDDGFDLSDSMYNAFRKALPHLRFCGLTATPFRMASNMNGTELRFITRTVPRIFHEVIHYTQNSELVAGGWWTKLEYKISKTFDRSKIKLNSAASDYNKASLQQYLFDSGHQSKILKAVEWAFTQGRRNMIVFTPSVAESEELVRRMGSDFAMVSADTPPDERTDIIKGFRSGRIKGITNYGVLIHGFDYPELECVIDAAPTLSLSRLYQKWGRGVRPHPNKESCWIVDLVGGHEMFGKIEDLTLYCEGTNKWFIAGRPGGSNKSEKKLTNVYLQGEAGMKRCQICKSTDIFFMRHCVTGNSATLSRPTGGVKPNIALRKNEQGKTVYEIVGVGHPSAEFVNHRSVCRVKK